MDLEIAYTVSMLRAKAHYFDVTMRVPPAPDKDAGELRLAMPVWTPGHYLVEDFARNVPDVKAYDSASGRQLTVQKVGKSEWSVNRGDSGGGVRVEYSVYAFAYSVNTSYIDAQHAIINGASVFVYAEGMKESPVTLKLILPPEWGTVSTGLGASGLEFSATNYDVLVDSPIEAGNQDVRSFDAGEAKYEVSIFGAAPIDREEFVSDIKRIVQSTVKVIGQVPFKRYVFLVNFTDNVGGGLEHLNSTVCFAPRFRLMPKEEYRQSMTLFSHEFFHAWNVKRMRPVGLGPFDYSREVYTRSLWIAEGITSYYDDLVLRRSGIFTVEEYLDAFVFNINIMKSLPGSRVQSAEEASFDSWIKLYKPNENTQNTYLSYYTQGAVIGWMLDMSIRRTTSGGNTLDDVMRKVYETTYLKGRGYREEEFESACVELGGEGAKEVFDSRVRGREDLDYDRYLGYAGLKLTDKDISNPPKGFLGIKLGSEGGRTTVKSRLAGSPAEEMGLSVNDEILGLDGMRMGADRISFYVGLAKPGQRLALLVARDGKLLELGGEVRARPTFEYKIQPLENASPDQKSLFKGWMMEDWRSELKYPDYVKSPDRRPVFDFV